MDYQTRMVDCAKLIAKIAGEISSKAATDTQKVAQLSADLAHKYTQLAHDSVGAAAAASNGEVGIRLKVSVAIKLSLSDLITNAFVRSGSRPATRKCLC